MKQTATWTDLEIIRLSEVSQKQKAKHHMMPLTCGIKRMAQMNLSMRQRQKPCGREQTVVAKRDGVG